MRNFTRNPEIRRQLWLYALLTLLAFAVGSLWLGLPSGLLAGGTALVAAILHFVTSVHRYRTLHRLSAQIDRVLHGQEQFAVTQYQEGELAILTCEIQKMTARLRDAADHLAKDKQWLADAMADLSHQLRTPLTSMNLVVTMLSRENLSAAERMELTRELRRLLQRTDWLVESLLKMSRLDANAVIFRRQEVPLSQIVGKAAQPLAIPLELRGIGLTVCVGEETVRADFAWTAEAIGNILKNCMEHTPDGGKITVQSRQTGLFTELRIQDTGCGFVPQDLPRLFERFYSGQNASENSFGIGLALSRMVLHQQDATIRAGNRPEGGAEFTIRFYPSAV